MSRDQRNLQVIAASDLGKQEIVFDSGDCLSADALITSFATQAAFLPGGGHEFGVFLP
jgi:hypothetical protein